jgi:hypothetical protein
MDRNHRTHSDTPDRSSGRRSLRRLGVLAVTAASGVALAASAASAAGPAGTWYMADVFRVDGYYDTWMLNADGDDQWEYFYIDTDVYPDGYVDVGVFDLYGDGSILFYDLAPLDGTFETLAGSDGQPTGQTGPPITIDPGPVPLSPPGMPNSGCLPFTLPDGWQCGPA